jgi:quercetin dioxygenase-like cupin family protein
MTRPGDRLENPTSGIALAFRVTAQDSGGKCVEVEATYGPHSERPPDHFHPSQSERFEMLEGEMTVRIEGEPRILRAGDVLDIPPGTVHAMWNATDAPARVIWRTTPALATQQFFETVWGLAREGRVGPKGTPPLLQLAVIAQAYRREIRVTRPPLWLQPVVFGLLAGLGRLRGYRARYDRFSGGAP